MLILAGGLGTRLRSITGELPKVMAEVNGIPFISVNLELLKRGGFKNFILCLGFGAEQVEEYLGDGSQYGINIQYSYDGAPRDNYSGGTAHAIREALPLASSTFWTLNGDTLLPLDYGRMLQVHEESKSLATISLCETKDRGWEPNVHYDSGAVRLYRKGAPTEAMQYVDAGVGLFHKDVFESTAEIKQLPELYERLSFEGRLLGFPGESRYYDINTPESLQETAEHLAVSYSEMRLS